LAKIIHMVRGFFIKHVSLLCREDRRVEEEALEVLEAASKLRPGSGLPQHSATLQDTLEVELDEVVEIKMRQVGCRTPGH
jgi:hypothetical protein